MADVTSETPSAVKEEDKWARSQRVFEAVVHTYEGEDGLVPEDLREASFVKRARRFRAKSHQPLVEALRVAYDAINPSDLGGINMHEWNERLKAASATIRSVLDVAESGKADPAVVTPLPHQEGCPRATESEALSFEALTVEVARLREALAEMTDERNGCMRTAEEQAALYVEHLDRAVKAEADVLRLRAREQTYGQHKAGCLALLVTYLPPDQRPHVTACSCGFEADGGGLP